MTDNIKDTNASDFLNCCWLVRLPTWAVNLGKTIGSAFDVVNITLSFELAIMITKLSDFRYKDQLLERFYEVHHLIIVPMCTIVGLYLIFKQRRPCYDCEKGCPIGTLYGMPSGDALYGAVIGCYASKKNLLIGIITMLSVCFSRVSKGYHSVLQTIVGASIGISIYFIQKFAGYKFEIFNWLIALFLPLQALFDKNLKVATPKKFDNLHAWLFFDISTLLFDFLLCPPEPYNFFANVSIAVPAFIYYFTVFLSSTFAIYIIEHGISMSLV